jgi:hypothetical protein
MAVDDLGDDVGEVGLRIDGIEFAAFETPRSPASSLRHLRQLRGAEVRQNGNGQLCENHDRN